MARLIMKLLGLRSCTRKCPFAVFQYLWKNTIMRLSEAIIRLEQICLILHAVAPLIEIRSVTLIWRHNGRDGVSNHQPHDCLLNRYSGADQRKHQSSASLAFVRGSHRWPVNSSHKWSVMRKMFPFDDVFMDDFAVRGNPWRFIYDPFDLSMRYNVLHLQEIASHPCFVWQIVASLLPRRYLRQCLYYTNWIIREKGDVIQNAIIFHREYPLDIVHYSYVIKNVMAFEITIVSIVCLTSADRRKHQSSASLAFLRGIHRWRVVSLHQYRGKCLQLMMHHGCLKNRW